MAAAPLVSVLLPNAPTARCRDALKGQTHRAHELVVLADAAGAAPPRGGDVLAFLDADAAPHPDWIAAALRQLAADASVGVVAPLLFAADYPPVVVGAGSGLTWRGDRFIVADGAPYEFVVPPATVPYAPCCGLLVRRTVLDAVGPLELFDDRRRDEVDLGLRTWALGWRVAVCPDAWVDCSASLTPPIEPVRERIRVALTYFTGRHLRRWLRHELASAPAAAAAWGWNLRRLRSTRRVRHRFAGGAERIWPLLTPTWEAAPIPAPNGSRRPDPQRAGGEVELDGDSDAGRIGFGWYEARRDGARPYRRSASIASAVVRLPSGAARCRVVWRGPRALEAVSLVVRPWGERAPSWQVTLAPPPEAWEQRRLGCALAAGDYEVLVRCAPPYRDANGRERGVDIAAIEFDR